MEDRPRCPRTNAILFGFFAQTGYRRGTAAHTAGPALLKMTAFRPARSGFHFPFLTRCVETAVNRSTHIPYEGVPFEPEVFLARNSPLKITRKYLHKYLLLKLRGQIPLELKHLNSSQRILWIYTRRNFGDAIMDMAGRALLRGMNVPIDLFTLPSLHKLFAQDDVFQHVFSDLREVVGRQYDAILMSEFNLPSIRLKNRHFAKLPYACLFQYFNGPDRNQTDFSYASVNDVFSLGHAASELQSISKPYLASTPDTVQSVLPFIPDTPFLALAVGGLDPNRTYSHWPAVLDLMDRSDDLRILKRVVLLGSDNGLAMAEQLAAQRFRHLQISSCVGKLTLLQSREVAARASLFLGADGGLMHVAHTTPVPSVSLFGIKEPPYLRLTGQCHSIGLQSKGNVDTIAPAEVVQAIARQVATYGAATAAARDSAHQLNPPETA
ncbi:glycosyltransferase family 9 protein [Paraburkholderia silvatlantica]|uniref:glycosyltransferase family 9 protein n=1 Tax=Paraburkholderia silvatlantica TaxID=321895 RepID=UPI00105EEB2F|nr:glycosyltransferase family 9 protein [Paraburkholderia silvatlantica]